jgi:hypothetical protein
VHAGATEAGAGKEGAELADRQCRLGEVVSQCPGLIGRVLEQLVANRVPQLVVVVLEARRGAVLEPATLEPYDIQAGFR